MATTTSAMNAERALEMGMDYNFGQKNHWRRWLHNRIAERLRVPAREAVVLYLAGDQDLDRAEFLRRGYRPDNLIAVDTDAAVVAALRRRGVIAVQGEIETVARLWTRRLDVVLADFTGPLSDTRFKALMLNFLPPEQSAVWAVNLLRGRECTSDVVHSGFRNEDVLGSLAKHFGVNASMHRGYRLIAAAAIFIMNAVVRRADIVQGTEQDKMHDLLKMQFDSRPAFFSYRSKAASQTFDSVVFCCEPFRAFWPRWLEVLPDQLTASEIVVRRRIAAALAHSTRRVGNPMPAKDAPLPVLH